MSDAVRVCDDEGRSEKEKEERRDKLHDMRCPLIRKHVEQTEMWESDQHQSQQNRGK